MTRVKILTECVVGLMLTFSLEPISCVVGEKLVYKAKDDCDEYFANKAKEDAAKNAAQVDDILKDMREQWLDELEKAREEMNKEGAIISIK